MFKSLIAALVITALLVAAVPSPRPAHAWVEPIFVALCVISGVCKDKKDKAADAKKKDEKREERPQAAEPRRGEEGPHEPPQSP